MVCCLDVRQGELDCHAKYVSLVRLMWLCLIKTLLNIALLIAIFTIYVLYLCRKIKLNYKVVAYEFFTKDNYNSFITRFNCL